MRSWRELLFGVLLYKRQTSPGLWFSGLARANQSFIEYEPRLGFIIFLGSCCMGYSDKWCLKIERRIKEPCLDVCENVWAWIQPMMIILSELISGNEFDELELISRLDFYSSSELCQTSSRVWKSRCTLSRRGRTGDAKRSPPRLAKRAAAAAWPFCNAMTRGNSNWQNQRGLK